MTVPSVTLDEISKVIQNDRSDAAVKKVAVGILNDFMDLQYGKSTPYTTGKTILPVETTIEDVDSAAENTTVEPKYKALFDKISVTYKSGDLTPQSKNGDNGVFWEPSLTPVLVLLKPNP